MIDERTRLNAIQQVRRKLDEVRGDLTEQMLLAHGEGMSLRKIAEAAGLSHEQVRRIVSR